MQRILLSSFPLFIALAFVLSSCAAIEGIFKAGFWSAIIMVVLVIGGVVFLISRLGGGKKSL